MPKLLKSNFSKLYKILGFTLLFSSVIPSVFAEEIDFYNFPTGEQEGGGVRGELNSCNNNVSYPVPLIPENTQTLTAAASPKLFFDTSNVKKASVLDFLLLDRDDRVVYQDVIKTNKNAGLVSVDLSDRHNANELKINNDYHWYLVQNCDDLSDPKIVASGSLQRIELEKRLAQKITEASTIDKINIYQEANIWHEAVDSLTQLKCNTSDTEAVNDQLTKITKITNFSSESLDSSLDNYCTANLKPESIVMK